jgi:ribA/ribD-fused uncharacterized protein
MTEAELLAQDTYDRSKCVVFLKTKERYGGLSNMCGGFALRLNGEDILTSEALYQACRFPDHPDVQRLIIEQKNPMRAKMASKPHRKDKCRADWDQVRVDVMRWCLRVKLAQNFDAFGGELLYTDKRPIVEETSKHDVFWGAKDQGDGTLKGANVLGKLLMELRARYKADPKALRSVPPPRIENFRLMGQEIGTITTT